MKTISILRHAKSDWDSGAKTDFERPLNKRGKKDAPIIGEFLEANPDQPEIILSSPAKRAITTAKLVREQLSQYPDLLEIESFYGANASDIISEINKIDDKINSILVVGHNPTMESLVEFLCAQHLKIKVPTAGLIRFIFDYDSWGLVSKNSCTMKWMLIPKALKAYRNKRES